MMLKTTDQLWKRKEEEETCRWKMQKYITVVHVRFAHSISIKKSSVKRTREREKEKRSIFTENSLQRYRFISPIVRFPWRYGSHSEAIHVRIEPKLPFPPLYIYIHVYTPPLPSSRVVEIVTNAGNVAAGRIESPRNPGRRPARCCKRCSSWRFRFSWPGH